MATHPPHLLDQLNNTHPSTFVPFCAFQTQLGISKPFTLLPNSSFPVCNSFNPVALEGQLCYNVKLNMTGLKGKNGGLVLVLDMNEDRALSFGVSTHHPEREKDLTKLRLEDQDEEDARNSAKIHLRLLTPFAEFGEGSYEMTSVKNVKGTKAFLHMQESERQCRYENAEECGNRKVFEECNCVLWELQPIQVIFFLSLSVFSGGCPLLSWGKRVH